MEYLTQKNKAYCSRCRYRGLHSESYLCQYILIAGERRGCAPGAGCDKRKISEGRAKTGYAGRYGEDLY